MAKPNKPTKAASQQKPVLSFPWPQGDMRREEQAQVMLGDLYASSAPVPLKVIPLWRFARGAELLTVDVHSLGDGSTQIWFHKGVARRPFEVSPLLHPRDGEGWLLEKLVVLLKAGWVKQDIDE